MPTTSMASQNPAADAFCAVLFTAMGGLIHANSGLFVKRLVEAIPIPSVSTDLDKWDWCFVGSELLNGCGDVFYCLI